MTELMSNWRRWVEAGPENVLFSFIIARGTGKQTTNARLVYLTEGFVSDRSFFCSGTTLRTRQETVKPGAREKKTKQKKQKTNAVESLAMTSTDRYSYLAPKSVDQNLAKRAKSETQRILRDEVEEIQKSKPLNQKKTQQKNKRAAPPTCSAVPRCPFAVFEQAASGGQLW